MPGLYLGYFGDLYQKIKTENLKKTLQLPKPSRSPKGHVKDICEDCFQVGTLQFFIYFWFYFSDSGDPTCMAPSTGGVMLNNQVFHDAVPCCFAQMCMDLLYFLPFQIFECRFPGPLQHPRHWSRPVEVSSLWEAICDSKEGQKWRRIWRRKDSLIEKEIRLQWVKSSFRCLHGVGLQTFYGQLLWLTPCTKPIWLAMNFQNWVTAHNMVLFGSTVNHHGLHRKSMKIHQRNKWVDAYISYWNCITISLNFYDFFFRRCSSLITEFW